MPKRSSSASRSFLADVPPGVIAAARQTLTDSDVVYEELDGPIDFVLKAVHATEQIPVEHLDQAAVQDRLAEARCRHWLPIIEARPEEDCVLVVTPHLASSAQKLARDQTRLTPGQLQAIVDGVLAGLAEIRHVARRPHGNLKPSNVLLRSSHFITADRVTLTDPAPTVIARPMNDANDLRRLGELIHWLVLHRPMLPVDWPVPLSPEWEQLGPDGPKWRELCMRLTHPRGPELSMAQVT